MSSREQRADVERRLALVCDFIISAIDDPGLLALIPENAYVAFGDESDPAFTERSRALLNSPAIRIESLFTNVIDLQAAGRDSP